MITFASVLDLINISREFSVGTWGLHPVWCRCKGPSG